MTFITEVAVLGGIVAGLGLTLVVRYFMPAHPDLSDAMGRMSTHSSTFALPPAHGLQERIGYALQRHASNVPGLRIPTKELAILRIPVHQWLGEKALLGLIGLAFPPLMSTVMSFLGLTLPIYLPVGASLLLGVGLFLVPSLTVRERAGRAREEFARAVGAYVELVALERMGGTGTTQSLEAAAEIGDSWAIQRIREELLRSRLSGVTPWHGLRELAEELGVSQLEDLADIMRLAGEEGAQVYEALRARGRALRTEMLTAEQARANAASEAMVVPVACLGFIFVLILAGPAIFRIMG